MQTAKTTEYARALLASYGSHAPVIAARRMQASNAAGQCREAENWRRIRLAIAEMRGPRQT